MFKYKLKLNTLQPDLQFSAGKCFTKAQEYASWPIENQFIVSYYHIYHIHF
jgi:hypothetical protein